MNLNFASDNTGPVAPEIMAAMLAANTGAAMPYGNDPSMEALRARVRAVFEMPDAEVLLVTVGTAANALALATLTRPFETVFCHRLAHIDVDECGAPEFYTSGAKLTLVDGPDAKMTPETLRATITRMDTDVHSVQRGALSLTNLTEMGTLYTLEELQALTEVAREFGLGTHLDGARFANACASLGCTAAQMAQGFDMISFGGTKNGCMGVEALIIRNPDHAWETALRRKRAGHLWSKNRFLAAQMNTYLEDDLWLRLAARSNAAGQRLAAGLAALGAHLEAKPAGNMIFARLPQAIHDRAFAGGARYSLSDTTEKGVRARFVCDWSKTDAEVDHLLALLQDSVAQNVRTAPATATGSVTGSM